MIQKQSVFKTKALSNKIKRRKLIQKNQKKLCARQASIKFKILIHF